MEGLYKAGKLHAIGYLDLERFAEIKPAVNQVKTHVF